METIAGVQRAIRAWRRDHRRGPLPVSLRQRVGRLSAQLSEEEAREAFGVRATIVRRWREEFGAAEGDGGSGRSFVELEPEVARQMVPETKRSGLRIELAGPGGHVVRIDGVRDAMEVATIVRALRPGNGA